MNMYPKKIPAALATGVTVALLLTAGSCSSQQPQPQPTCYEADGDVCDDDPYDLDDLFGKHKTKAPAVKPTVKKTSGTTTRRR